MAKNRKFLSPKRSIVDVWLAYKYAAPSFLRLLLRNQCYCFLLPFLWRRKELNQILAASFKYLTNTQVLVKLFQRILHYGYTPLTICTATIKIFENLHTLNPFHSTSGLFPKRFMKILQCTWICLIVRLRKQNTILSHCWIYHHCMNIISSLQLGTWDWYIFPSLSAMFSLKSIILSFRY